MKLTSSILLSFLCVVISITSSSGALHTKPFLQVAEGSNNFTNKFLPVLMRNSRSRNAIYSPLSVYSILISMYLASEGEAKSEIKWHAYFIDNDVDLKFEFRTVLDSIERHEKIAKVRTANNIWIENKHSIDGKFNTSSHNCCNVDVDVFNPNKVMESLNKINGKVEEKTHGLVKDVIVMDYVVKARVMIVSSIYFTGEWAHKFYYSSSTEKSIFHVSETEGTMVNMMQVVAKFNTGRVPGLNADYVELPFKNFEIWGRARAITMFIIRPDAFKDLEQVVNNFEKIHISELDAEPKNLNVFLPQFKIESEFELIRSMTEVGIRMVFDSRGTVNMVNGNVSTPVDLFMQKVSLEINEIGGNINSGESATKPPDANDYPKFRVDSPFLAIILDNETKAKILIARIIHPNE